MPNFSSREKERLEELISNLKSLNNRLQSSKKSKPFVQENSDWFTLNEAVNEIEKTLQFHESGKMMAEALFAFLEEPMKELIDQKIEHHNWGEHDGPESG